MLYAVSISPHSEPTPNRRRFDFHFHPSQQKFCSISHRPYMYLTECGLARNEEVY